MIRLENLSKSYSGKPVLQELSLELAEGARLVVLVPSGCGKTTLLRLVAGLELPDAGRVSLDGRLASQPGWGLPPYARSIGFAFQSPTLWPHLSVVRNLTFGMNGASKSHVKETVEELANAFDLTGLLGRYPGQLSGGEARRVGLARALAMRPRRLLLDEPLTNLDGELKERIFKETLAFIEGFHPAVIFVTHDPGEAAALVENGASLLRLENIGRAA
ncbi:MAG: ATP-binding cassette domain-containing protein [Anaerolineaceae bacterium]